MTPGLTNWAGNYAYRATTLHQPSSVDELRAIAAHAPKLHALGTRHCFNDIADSAELVALDALPPELTIDRAAGTVTINPSITYGTLAAKLEQAGLALHNMASLPHISVGGATATATHGSGDRSRNLAGAVAAIELVTSEGEIVRAARGDADFAGMVVHLGALGVVTRLTLDVQPSYLVRQQVFEHLPWEVLFDRFDAVMGAADSVSLFIDYRSDVNQIWLKSRVDPANPAPLRKELLGAKAATGPIHPVSELSPVHCTAQMGEPGPWCDRLPHFRVDAVPASGDELQSEWMVARRDAVAALRAVRELAPVFRPHLWTSEVRSVAADDLWLSTAYGTDTVCLHFSWKQDETAAARLLPEIEAALAPFAPRPHWGKLFAATAAELAPRYERFADFRRLAERLDPRGAFRNAYLDRCLYG
jgi:xylitol oxidase